MLKILQPLPAPVLKVGGVQTAAQLPKIWAGREAVPL
jgi:hypothetical protein